ncbi:hypothetical protein HDU87_003022 [Geranomyces variabilis]|uniref:Uncharacterized protein n=1 Tax=Geranomyces variabilis TaxID=109894 RepID=A0AAD5TKW6_9FUNG|nr:hypothetical protein HDU87_003022 [Geranomyces variabilis]
MPSTDASASDEDYSNTDGSDASDDESSLEGPLAAMALSPRKAVAKLSADAPAAPVRGVERKATATSQAFDGEQADGVSASPAPSAKGSATQPNAYPFGQKFFSWKAPFDAPPYLGGPLPRVLAKPLSKAVARTSPAPFVFKVNFNASPITPANGQIANANLRELLLNIDPTLRTTDRFDKVLLGNDDLVRVPQHGVLGSLVVDSDYVDENYPVIGEEKHDIYLNTHSPFCLIAVGVQGSGKSHSLASVIENCMLNAQPCIEAQKPATAMIFHYDQDPENFCEAITLTGRRAGLPVSVPVVSRMTILVSPSFYKQRRAFYRAKNIPNCEVKPLLFKWNDLYADQIKKLMRVGENTDTIPLYMSSILDLLRAMQKENRKPSWAQFKKELTSLPLLPQQMVPLQQRLKLLESLLVDADSDRNAVDVRQILSSGCPMIIVDMTDPMMTASESNSVFQVMLAAFLGTTTPAGKLVVLDESHKYLAEDGHDGLALALVTACRQMRHVGLRICVSTQSPEVLPAELLELVSVALIHRFHSPDWFKWMQKKLPMREEVFEEIVGIETGTAMAVSARWAKGAPGKGFVRKIRIRARITKDGGVSKTADLWTADL